MQAPKCRPVLHNERCEGGEGAEFRGDEDDRLGTPALFAHEIIIQEHHFENLKDLEAHDA